MLDTSQIRSQFPALHQTTPEGTIPIFFDNPAGTQVHQSVIDVYRIYFETMNANSGGHFATSQRTDELVQSAREVMADFINAPSPDEIVFGPNMTTLCFQLSRAIARTLKAGDEIVLTRMDHDANVAPWLHIAEDYGLTVRWVDIHTEDATLDLNTLEAALTDRTKVVATVHASNAVGTVNPVKQIAQMAHAAGALYVVDAVQSAPHIPLDVQDIGCDFLLCSAYKFFGPHMGILWGKYDLLASLPAYKVRPAKNKPPHRWETGTASFEGIAATRAAVQYLGWVGEQFGGGYTSAFADYATQRQHYKTGMEAIRRQEQTLVARLIDVLHALPGVNIYGITNPARYDERCPTVVFTHTHHSADAIATYLAERNIYVWSGDYYAVEIMRRLDHAEDGMVRVGLAHYNTLDEIEQMADALRHFLR